MIRDPNEGPRVTKTALAFCAMAKWKGNQGGPRLYMFIQSCVHAAGDMTAAACCDRCEGWRSMDTFSTRQARHRSATNASTWNVTSLPSSHYPNRRECWLADPGHAITHMTQKKLLQHQQHTSLRSVHCQCWEQAPSGLNEAQTWEKGRQDDMKDHEQVCSFQKAIFLLERLSVIFFINNLQVKVVMLLLLFFFTLPMVFFFRLKKYIY